MDQFPLAQGYLRCMHYALDIAFAGWARFAELGMRGLGLAAVFFLVMLLIVAMATRRGES